MPFPSLALSLTLLSEGNSYAAPGETLVISHWRGSSDRQNMILDSVQRSDEVYGLEPKEGGAVKVTAFWKIVTFGLFPHWLL